MNNESLIKGLFLIAFSLLFGVQSFNYSMGRLGNVGPGLFPAIVSGILLMIGASIVVRSVVTAKVPIDIV